MSPRQQSEHYEKYKVKVRNEERIRLYESESDED